LEVWRVIKSVCLASFVAIILTYLLKVQDFPRSVLIMSVALISITFVFMAGAKEILVDYMLARGYNTLNVVIVGAGKVGTMLAQEIQKRPGLGLRVAGFLDDLKVNQTISKI